MINQIIDESEPELKQAQITAIFSMDQGTPSILKSGIAQVDDPVVGKGGWYDEQRQPLGITHVTLVKTESPAFLIRKEGLNEEPSLVSDNGLIETVHVGDQVDGLFEFLAPPDDARQGARTFAR